MHDIVWSGGGGLTSYQGSSSLCCAIGGRERPASQARHNPSSPLTAQQRAVVHALHLETGWRSVRLARALHMTEWQVRGAMKGLRL